MQILNVLSLILFDLPLTMFAIFPLISFMSESRIVPNGVPFVSSLGPCVGRKYSIEDFLNKNIVFATEDSIGLFFQRKPSMLYLAGFSNFVPVRPLCLLVKFNVDTARLFLRVEGICDPLNTLLEISLFGPS